MLPLSEVTQTSESPKQLLETQQAAETVSTEVNQIGVSVVLTHTDSPTEFYIQWSQETDAINNLHALLQVCSLILHRFPPQCPVVFRSWLPNFRT